MDKEKFLTERLKNLNKSNVNLPFLDEKSILLYMCFREKTTVEEIKYLLSLGAEPNISTNREFYSETLLNVLCCETITPKKEEIILLLIEYGANPFETDQLDRNVFTILNIKSNHKFMTKIIFKVFETKYKMSKKLFKSKRQVLPLKVINLLSKEKFDKLDQLFSNNHIINKKNLKIPEQETQKQTQTQTQEQTQLQTQTQKQTQTQTQTDREIKKENQNINFLYDVNEQEEMSFANTLHVLFLYRDLSVIKLEWIKFLVSNGINLNSKMVYNVQPLHILFLNDRPPAAIAEYLINNGADLKSTTSFNKESALHLACNQDNPSLPLIKLMVQNGADIHQVIEGKYTILHILCIMKNSPFEIIKYFVDLGCNLNSMTLSGQTPFHLLLSKDNADLEIIKYFIKKGVNINRLANNQKCVFHYLCEHKKPSLKLFKFFHDYISIENEKRKNLKKKVNENNSNENELYFDINYSNRHNISPLNYFLGRSTINYEICYFLINNGADIHTANNATQYTPLHQIFMNQNYNLNIVKLLIQKGAKVNILDKFNCTPFYYLIGSVMRKINKDHIKLEIPSDDIN
ncbi:ankyrin repeat-containing protein [Anaeramoeba flamelloides]|uniref:Ankyrin repeat-containing protein n=1 Tax=Anaeramoeba flamelloides TaxID=1746091 RepID=A0ABQ8YT57_9EUKA|nr:ankyrin repeat-containing protein [Anaeramoeba flamelloides]